MKKILRHSPILVLLLAAFLFSGLSAKSQRATGRGIAPLAEIEMRIDTLSFNYSRDRVTFRGERHLAFRYDKDETVVELRMTPADRLPERPQLELLPSPDFDVLDTLTYIDSDNGGYFRTRLRFKSLSDTDFLSLTIDTRTAGEARTISVPLLPYTRTRAEIHTGNDDLYIGEEKRFEITTTHLNNLVLDGMWKTEGDLEYRLFEKGGTGYLAVIPGSAGAHELEVTLETKRPMLTATLETTFELDPITVSFLARGSRLIFLKMDQKEIIREKDDVNGVEVQIDSHRSLSINNTYRIEDREERGGHLVAELYTQRRLSNDRVLCILRPYANHRITDGYLFIKDGDKPEFITNINIAPDAEIQSIAILREGGEWVSTRTVKPGETLDLRLEGIGMLQARFHFEGLEILERDSITRTERSVHFRLRVPVDVKQRTIEIYNRDKKMGIALAVAEYQRPRPLDFVTVNYGEGQKTLSELDNTILYNHAVNDVIIDFDRDKIDRGDELYGRQWLEVEVRLKGPKNELLEMQQIPLIAVCPGSASPRSEFYGQKNCAMQAISINSILSQKTHSLDSWSKIEILIRHKTERYEGEGYSKRIDIVRQRFTTFDVELSLPAGLVIQRFGEANFEGLAGISLAMLAQLSFYDREAVQKQKPYKLGGGFLFINAFNLNPEVTDRDLGIVVLGSVYPTGADRKLSFPLYGGGGYFLNDAQFFLLLGLGIRLSF